MTRHRASDAQRPSQWRQAGENRVHRDIAPGQLWQHRTSTAKVIRIAEVNGKRVSWQQVTGGTRPDGSMDIASLHTHYLRAEAAPPEAAGAPAVGQNGRPLTEEEYQAVKRLQVLARVWPESLVLVIAGGELHVVHEDDDAFGPDDTRRSRGRVLKTFGEIKVMEDW